MALCARGGDNSFRPFCVGRNFRCLGDWDLARTWLLSAKSKPRPYVWIDYEFALLELGVGNLRAAGEAMSGFLAAAEAVTPRVVASAQQRRAIVSVFHALFEVDRAAALHGYRRAEAAGYGDWLTRMRLAEDMLESGLVEHAAAQIDMLRAHVDDNETNWVMGRILQASGRPAEAAQATSRWRWGLSWSETPDVASFPIAGRVASMIATSAPR